MVEGRGRRSRARSARVHVIPFPVNEPELWPAYVPAGVTQYIRLFSDWGGTKLDRLREAGYEVVVLDEGAEKDVSGVEVRTLREAATGRLVRGRGRVISRRAGLRRRSRRNPHLSRGSAVARHPP